MTCLHRLSLWLQIAALGIGIGGCQSLVQQIQSPSEASFAQASVKGVTVVREQSLQFSPHPVGMNLHVIDDVSRSGMVDILRQTKARIVRWPGGSEADRYQWRTHRLLPPWVVHPNASFDRLMQRLVQPAQVDVAITLNYGSNAAGNGGGDPNEAAAWVREAKSKGYRIPYWTVGNEVFGSWELDLNSKPHDAGTYAAKVADAFYPQIKAADPNAKVGIVVNPYGYDLQNPLGWTPTVLRRARYDFVEVHYYPQEPNAGSDDFLLTKAVPQFRQQILGLRRAMGNRPVPILLGEFNNVANRPNKQTLSIVNALYHGLMYAESAQLGLVGAFPWEMTEDYCTHPPDTRFEPTGDFSSKLYGWQSFSTYSLFSIGLPSSSKSCSKGVPTLPFGTPFPTAHAATLFGEFAGPREQLLQTKISADFKSIRVYAATHGKGYRLLLFNLDPNTAQKLPIQLNTAGGTWKLQQTTYGKAEYDQSRYQRWVGPTRQSLGKVTQPFDVNIPPWSMSVVSMDP